MNIKAAMCARGIDFTSVSALSDWISELYRQCDILELYRQCDILELHRQCVILELYRQ